MTYASPMFVEPLSGQQYPFSEPRWRSDDGKPLMITDLKGLDRHDIDTHVRSLWRYHAAFPITFSSPVSLGEGMTPMVEKTWSDMPVQFKLEWFAPTASFKDRGASLVVSFLKHIGVDAFLEDSSGNGGAAMAAYGAAANMDVMILTPQTTLSAKLMQMKVFGANIVLVPGSRQASEEQAILRSKDIFYASHNWHPFFLQGTKTIAYEIWEDLGFRAPDNVIVPVGAGSLALGCGLGFSELLRNKQIDKMPRIFGVQPSACAPITTGFAAGLPTDQPHDFQPTIAAGASISKPVRGREILEFVRRSEGKMLAVSEAQIKKAARDLASIGLFVEPTSALAAAGVRCLKQNGDINASQTTIAVLSGSGLKAADQVEGLFGYT